MSSIIKSMSKMISGNRGSGGKGINMNFFQNRIVLYIIFAVSIVNLYAFLTSNDMFSLVIFCLVGFITTFFSKNMIVVLSIAIVVTNILKQGTGIRTTEGFEDDSAKADTSVKSEDSPTPDSTVGDVADEGEKLSDMKSKYDELMKLQEQIVSGVKSVYEPLQKAEGIVSNMKENMKNITKDGKK
jgi:hypothetical protein